MSDPVLLTGATGFVGGHVARRLAAEGMALRALVRPGTDATRLQELDVEIHRGDVTDRRSVTAAMTGCRGVVHVAGAAGWQRRPGRYAEVNVRGTRHVLSAATAEPAVERLLHVSSVVTIGERSGETATESTPHRGTFLREYERTKHAAEVEVRRAADDGLDAVIVNPTGVIGPHFTGMTRQALEGYLTRRLPTIPDPDQRINLVHVGDVAEGILAAWHRGRRGERYILGGENLTIGDMFRRCEELTGVPAPRRTLPAPVAWAVAGGMELVARLGGPPPRLTRDLLRVSRHGMIADSGRAATELGYAPRDATEALRDTLEWLAGEIGGRP